jgi:hypothetical protein
MTGRAQIRNAVFSLATALSLGFGAAQAFAAPGAPLQSNADSCTGTQWNQCYYSCRSQGYRSGICELYNGYPVCECIGIIQPGE